MNHEGLRWSVPCVANEGPGKRLNLYKRGFKIFDLLVVILVFHRVPRKRDVINTNVTVRIVVPG